jgi:amino acid adenylation domain-containing protein
VPGGAVAICMERSFDWIVAALAAMRAGAAYVPLDSAWPEARLRYAISDSGASVLVARQALLEHLSVTAFGVDPCRDAAAIDAAPAFSSPHLAPDSLAYVIYTSGSTGVPKGVEVTHANLCHLVRWHHAAFAVTAADRASHLAGLGFDAAVWEIWPYLAAGATLCLAEDSIRSSPELIQQWLLRERITISFVPTVHAAPIAALPWDASTTALRFLLTGGDALQHAPSASLPFALVNNYGPTENTVVATSGVVPPGSSLVPSIGRPIAGTTIYLLDENRRPVPDGETGEIYIGGDGVARGYRNLPDQTQTCFLPDPFAASPGARMYRTGDRACLRSNGEIEFRGRADRQTKIRGQRVELDEIASVLSRHPAVEFATVITTLSSAGENQLVAYALFKSGASLPSFSALQQHLRGSLPDYMVPATIVRLDSLPLSANGKIDLRLLPSPDSAPLLEDPRSAAPVSPVEKKLLAMVQGLLGSKAISPRDSFFLAGGHSLLGMQLVMRLRETFGVELTLRQLFEAPTVESLSGVVGALLHEKRVAAIWSDLLGRAEIGRDENFFNLGGLPALLPSLQQRLAREFGQWIPVADLAANPTIRQQGELTQKRTSAKPPLPAGVLALQPYGTRNNLFWVHYLTAELAKVIGDDQPLLYVALTSEDFPSLGPQPTLQAIAACLLRKIIAAQPKGPYNIGGLCLGGILAYEMASQLRAAGHEVSLLALVDPPNPAYIESFHSQKHIVNYFTYIVRRARRIGLRVTLAHIGGHISDYFARTFKTASTRTEMKIAQETIETAAMSYRPQKYDGKVLLLLASDRAPHKNFLPGWQAVVPQNLHTGYVPAHHRDLLTAENARSVAEAIVAHLGADAPVNFDLPAIPPEPPATNLQPAQA